MQSRKRGIGVNSISDLDFRALAPGVSWYYNWGATPLSKPADVAMEFLPMAWNGASSFQTSISSYLAAGNRPWRVFALNEPNLTTQASMTPADAATTFKQAKAICDPYNIPVVGPHMAIGTAANQSITAYDPLQGSNVTYTFQEPYLNAFLYYCGTNRPSGMSTHSYGGYGEITWILGTMHTDYPTQKVWLTEFCPWGATNDATVLSTLIPAVDYCERTPWVEGYAWFMSRISGDPYNSLLAGSGVLSAAGQAYVQMPVHDTNLFYHVPGRLQAERYVSLTSMDIAPTTDVDGLADMKATAAGGSLDYNLQVDTAGSYPLSLRVAGTGTIKIYQGGALLVSVNSLTSGWSTVGTTVPLVAGTQTLHVVLGANAQKLNWLEFLGLKGTPAVPSNLSATSSSNQVVLSWSTAAGATSYNVKRATVDGGPYTTIANTAFAGYTNTGLTIGATYYYVVSAVNAAGESTNSPQVSAITALPPVNLALNHPVTVSSVENSSYPGANAVDGNATSTRWSSAFSDPQWIYVDLQATYAITRVKLTWEAAYGKSYQIQVSSNASDWNTLYSTTTGGGGVEDLTGLAGTGRYVRMYGTTRATPYGYSLYEFEVYGSAVPTNHPPVLTAIANQTVLAGRTLQFTATATDPDVPAQPLSYSLLSAPVGASVGASSGVFTWRPAVAQSPSTQTVAVVVSDNATPPLMATQSFALTVLRPALPTLSTATLTNGHLGFWLNGDIGPDYIIQTSSNLTSWVPVFTNISPGLPAYWEATNAAPWASAFYRVLLGP